MKRISSYFLLACMALVCHAQDIDKEAALQEVEVKGASVVNKADGRLYYPTEQQKAASATGYEILQRLALPNILVNEVTHTVSAFNNKGEVQLRINDIMASRSDMMALNPQTIIRIDFIDSPGVRYGEGVAYVINIVTRRSDSGYTLGTNLSQALTAAKGDYSVFGKWNKGKGELSLDYDFGYQDLKGGRTAETACYTLTDGSLYTISRSDVATRTRSIGNSVQLKYNLADSAAYVFQVALDAGLTNAPGNYSQKAIADGVANYTATQRSQSQALLPSLDLYYHRQLTARQTLTINAVGTFIGTSSDYSYDEGTPYQYAVEGQTCSLMGEVIYENRLRPFTLSAGVNQRLKYTRNEYTGDAMSLNTMHNSTLYAFTQAKGRVGNLGYVAGVGVTSLRYSQQTHTYSFQWFRPKVALAYDLTNAWHLNYAFEYSNHVSQIAMISDVMIRNNSMEWTRGNPDLHPNRMTEHTLRLSFDNSRWYSHIECLYRGHPRPNMVAYERTADNRFIQTQRNQKAIDFLYLSAYARCWLVPEKLMVMGSGGMNRCMNFGDDYTHCLTSWDGTVSATAYLGHFTLSAYVTSGWRFMEGEGIGRSNASSSLWAAYRHKNWQFALTWLNPFVSNSLQNESELCSRYITKKVDIHSRDFANYLTLSVAWRFDKGRKYREIDREKRQKDTETGIMK